MPNTSATGAPLLPNGSPAPAPLEGQSFNRFLQQLVSAVTGIDGTLVRSRWQTEPPVIPPAATAWCSLGVTNRKADTFAYLGHVATGDGYDEFRRHEEFDLLCSFFDLGTNGLADYYASLLRDGLQVQTNLDLLRVASMGLIETGDLQTVPVLYKERWNYRVDLNVRIRRQILRNYPVLNILTANGTIDGSTPSGSIIPVTLAVSQ